MAFFNNRSVNLINLHYVIGSVAMGGGGAFYCIYLLKTGAGLAGALLSLAAIFAGRLLIRGFVLPLAVRFGLRWLVIVGSVLMGLSYGFLAHVTGVNATLFWFIAVAAIADVVYWPSYHAYFAALGDEEHRGQQIGIREAITATLGIASPLAAGWLLVTFGPMAAWYTTAAIQMLAAIPIFWAPDVVIAPSAPGALRAALSGAMLFVGDGLVAAGSGIAWQFALFFALGQSYIAYGGALAVAALVGAVSGPFLGRLIDSGKGTRALFVSSSILIAIIAARAIFYRNPAIAVVANALGALVQCLYIPTLMTVVYNRAKRSPCVMRFHMVAEGGWDVGITLGLSAGALLVWLGVSLGWVIAISLIGAIYSFVLLYRYYATHEAELVDASQTQPEEPINI